MEQGCLEIEIFITDLWVIASGKYETWERTQIKFGATHDL